MSRYETKRGGCTCNNGVCDMNCRMFRFLSGKPSNADRIRAMTDEELAEFIGDDAMHDICPNNCHDDLDRPCKVCALEWLKQEAEI